MIYSRIRANRGSTAWEAVIEVFLFAVFSYILAALLTGSTGNAHGSTNIQAILEDSDRIDWRELYIAIIVSGILAIALSYVFNYKLITKLGRLIRATRRFGDEDVWEYLHNSPDVEWVYLRDHQQGVTYYGRVAYFSDRFQDRELVLTEVIVYNNESGEQLYDLDGAYVARDSSTMTIEVPLFTSHVPGQLTGEQFQSLLAAASSTEQRLLEELYELIEGTKNYKLDPKASANKRRRIQALLNRQKVSVIHLNERGNQNEDPQ